MRIFIGIKASPMLQVEIGAWQKDHKKLPVRFLAPENLHMTLVPPWEENDIDVAIEKLHEATKEARGFEIVFNSVALGPHPRHPNLIWATADASEAASTLASHFKKRFGAEDNRPFLSHVTIARLGIERHGNPIPQLAQESVHWPEKASNICLFQSHQNSEYTILERIDL